MRLWLLASASLLVACGVALAQAADANGDGRITREELAAMHAVLFDHLDANKDGMVTADEGDPHFLDLADRNRDGFVTREENDVYASEAAEGDLGQCDVSGDSALSGNEITCITSADSSME